MIVLAIEDRFVKLWLTRVWHQDSLLEVRRSAEASVTVLTSSGSVAGKSPSSQTVGARVVQEGGTTQAENQNISCVMTVITI